MSTQLAQPASAGIIKLAEQPSIRQRIESVLGARANQFVTSVVQVTQGNATLQKCEPGSILASAMVAATLDLPVNPSLGFAYIVPYAGKAQFQMGYKGFIQLAQRSGQFRRISDVVIPAGVLVSWDPITETLELDWTKEKAGDPDGYCVYFELVNGFSKRIFWTREKVKAHAEKYSQAYRAQRKDSPWHDGFDGMALKTVIKHALSKYAPLSIDNRMAEAIDKDQSVIDIDGRQEYPDNPALPLQSDPFAQTETTTEEEK